MNCGFDEFKEIIDRLRGEGGCPWDREQTYESLKPCLVDEMTEILAAIDILKDTGNGDNLCEELGDLLMNVVMLARIAEEEGRFTMVDVVEGISRKMIRRHPHVFGTARVENSSQVLANWEEIKKKEKNGSDPDGRAREKAACPLAAQWMVQYLEDRYCSRCEQ